MAATGNQWETVRKPTKKVKSHVQNGNTKTNQKSLLDNMPRIETAPPVKESATIYDAFLEKERAQALKAEKLKQQTSGSVGNGSTTTKKSNPANKPKHTGGGEKKEQSITLEAAIKTISASELEGILSKVQATFPENPTIWLKDLVSVLNLKMDKVPEKDPVFSGKPRDYPLCMLTTSAKKMLTKTLNQCSTKTLENVLEHTINSMVVDISKDVSTYGYRMLIQLLIHNKPEILMSTLHKYHELMKANQNRPLRCIAIMWAVGQGGYKSLKDGLRIWMEFMFPVLGVRSLASYPVDYLEVLFKSHEDLSTASGCVSPKEFCAILDTLFTPQPSMPTAQLKRLQAHYPQFEHLALGHTPGNQQQLFREFFKRCTTSNRTLQPVVMAGLVKCLCQEKACFSEWRQLYTKANLKESGVLLHYLCNNWDKLHKKLDKNVARDTIGSFSVTNEDMSLKSGPDKIDGLQFCSLNCKELLSKMSGSGFSWRWLMVFILFSIAAVVGVDVYLHRGFNKSKTYQILDNSGTFVFVQQVWVRASVILDRIIVWLEQNCPYYYTKTCELVGPYLQLLWERLYDFGLWLVEVSKPARDWLNTTMPQVVEAIVLGCKWVAIQVVYFFNAASGWLLENVFVGKLSPENILATLSDLLSSLQYYVVSFIHWCSNLVSAA